MSVFLEERFPPTVCAPGQSRAGAPKGTPSHVYGPAATVSAIPAGHTTDTGTVGNLNTRQYWRRDHGRTRVSSFYPLRSGLRWSDCYLCDGEESVRQVPRGAGDAAGHRERHSQWPVLLHPRANAGRLLQWQWPGQRERPWHCRDPRLCDWPGRPRALWLLDLGDDRGLHRQADEAARHRQYRRRAGWWPRQRGVVAPAISLRLWAKANPASRGAGALWLAGFAFASTRAG